jgi:hypothetical protein
MAAVTQIGNRSDVAVQRALILKNERTGGRASCGRKFPLGAGCCWQTLFPPATSSWDWPPPG